MDRRGGGNYRDTGGSGASGSTGSSNPTRGRENGAAGGAAARSRDGSPSSQESTSAKENATANANNSTPNAQFISIRSRVGKRYQAALPELREKPSLTDSERAHKMLKVMHLSKPRYSLDKANALGNDLEKYLKMARSLRDGSTFDTDEQITCLALQYLHRFDYNTTDAACSLYARHSMELPKSASSSAAEPSTSTRLNNPADVEARWVAAFYKLMRLPRIEMNEYREMAQLLAKAASSGIAATEVGVLERLVNRLTQWLTAYEHVTNREVDRTDLERLVYQADDLMFATTAKQEMEKRLQAFDLTYGKLKDAVERHDRRNQAKCQLEELEELFAAVVAVQVNFPEKVEHSKILDEARELQNTIAKMLTEDRVSLTAMREVIARIELVPVNFEKQVDLFQQKMLNAQSWLAKVRKCIPKRRGSRRGSGPEPKKMDLQAIRALVDDAPCEDTAEMYEMQDLLECADEWAEKVKTAIEGGADVPLEVLKELMDEGNAMPVDMDEQKCLEAEIAAREWCSSAVVMLAAKKPFQDLEEMGEKAKAIRHHLHAKKQSRWKPQIERDIQSALDTARRWIHEIREVLGHAAFDKLFGSTSSNNTSVGTSDAALSAALDSPLSATSSRSEATEAFVKGKKSVDAVHKLLEKAEKLVVNVDTYTTRLHEVLALTSQAQEDAQAILVAVGVRAKDEEEQQETTMPAAASSLEQLGDFSYACSVLDKIANLPLIFDQALELFEIVHSGKDWTQRVRDAIPPRQSRKKRMAKHVTTLDDLQELLKESQQLKFEFSEEIKILSKELDDMAIWQQKAVEVVSSRALELIGGFATRLRKHDLLVYAKVASAKKKLLGGSEADGVDSEAMDVDGGPAVKAEGALSDSSSAQSSDSGAVHMTLATPSAPSEQDQWNGTNASGAGAGAGSGSATSSGGAAAAAGTDVAEPASAIPLVAEVFHVDGIVNTIRIEAGCAKRTSDDTTTTTEDASESGDAGDEKKNATINARSGISSLDPLFVFVEESILAVNAVEMKEDKTKRLEELMAAAGSSQEADDVMMASGSPDDAVKQLEAWRQQIAHVAEEGGLFNAVSPEQDALGVVVELLEWLQNARSIFYNEPLPLKELVANGRALEERLQAMRTEPKTFDDATCDLLATLLWPLSYLAKHDDVVQSWVARVAKCMEDKHAPMDDIQRLLSEAYSLLLEPDAFKLLLDELKKAKLWLAKLKKRLKTLMAKSVTTRLTMSVAKQLVEEGDEIAIELPAFDLLKEHVEIASDWETRVLSSGLETGQARIAQLLSLLDEYDRARLVIDLDMHREVLKSATERYCVCRQPYDGFMIGCDFCDDWFHDNCIGISKEKAEKVDNYTCPSCTILHELHSALQRAVDGQDRLWVDNEYGKSYEKQHAATIRKIKREEKAVERSEMLLFSCNNHMNQLRARIEDIERAKSCFTTLKNPFDGSATSSGSGSNLMSDSAAKFTAAAATSAASTAAVSTNTPRAAPSSLAVTLPLNASVVSSLAAASAASGTTVPSFVAAPTSSISSATKIPNVPMDTLAFVQRYPNILLPSAKFGVVQADATKPQVQLPLPEIPAASIPIPAVGTTATTTATNTDPTTTTVVEQQNAAVTQVTDTASTPVVPTLTVSPPAVASSMPAPVPVAAPATMVDMMPNMLAPMLAKLSENTERLSALLVAGGVEQQLTKMKSEHAEVKSQVQELQEMIRVSKDRMLTAQSTLEELKRAYVIRQHGLPRAKAWIQRVVRLINTPSILSRANFPVSASSAPPTSENPLSFLSPELYEVLTDAKAKEIAHFPEVKVYSQLVRAVGWTVVTVSLLQERPSREALMVAIVYANEHVLFDPLKAVAPLRSIIGRVDVWITRAQKCLGKQASQSQKVAKLKALMNEYSKLPLTCSWVQILDDYVKAVEMEAPDSDMSAEEFLRSQAELEAAAVEAVSAASSTWLPAPNPKIPRKRKTYTRKEKVDSSGGGGADAGDAAGGQVKASPGKAKKAKMTKASMKSKVVTLLAAAADVGAAQEELERTQTTKSDQGAAVTVTEDVAMADAPPLSTS